MEVPENILNLVIANNNASDHYIIRKAILEINHTHRITSVYNGSQLLDYLLRAGSYVNCPEPTPDCIFLDLDMPLLDGLSALQRIKSFNEFKKIPVFILSSIVNPVDKEKALALGANDVFIKPVDYTHLKGAVSAILERIGFTPPPKI